MGARDESGARARVDADSAVKGAFTAYESCAERRARHRMAALTGLVMLLAVAGILGALYGLTLPDPSKVRP